MGTTAAWVSNPRLLPIPSFFLRNELTAAMLSTFVQWLQKPEKYNARNSLPSLPFSCLCSKRFKPEMVAIKLRPRGMVHSLTQRLHAPTVSGFSSKASAQSHSELEVACPKMRKQTGWPLAKHLTCKYFELTLGMLSLNFGLMKNIKIL